MWVPRSLTKFHQLKLQEEQLVRERESCRSLFLYCCCSCDGERGEEEAAERGEARDARTRYSSPFSYSASIIETCVAWDVPPPLPLLPNSSVVVYNKATLSSTVRVRFA